jgi:acylphosphatase
MPLARRYLVNGRVQGVGFRYFVQAAAAREGLRGWVRNLPGGAVEALAEGDADALERFETQLRQGPSTARVDRVTVKNETPATTGTHFEIR